MTPARCRLTLALAITCGALVLGTLPAFAHVEFEPESGRAGSVIDAELFVENEKSDEGTVKVELQFPENTEIVLADLPAAPGWTSSVEGGSVGEPVSVVTWTRATAQPEDVTLPIQLGPLPAQATRLQFKVIQTYSGGDVESWIQDWPEGAPEPNMPGPIFNVTGTAPATTSTTPTTAAPTTTVPVTTPSTTVAGSEDAEDDDDSNVWVPIVIGAVIVLLIAGGVVYFVRRRRG